MVTSRWIWTVLLLGLGFTGNIQGFPAHISIDCETPQSVDLVTVPIPEEYEGMVEFLTLPQGAEIFLESPSCPDCVSFLELSYTVGDASALVFTKKPLDAEALKDPNPKPNGPFSSLSYSITCKKNGVRNNRTLALDDINDNAPVFEKKKYTKSVSEAKPVGSWVIEVQAFDSDVSPLYNSFRYSIEPPSATFTMAGGLMLLQEQLNYTLTKLYNLTVKAKDSFGKAGETTVVVHVLKPPGLNFEHDLYNAMIHENEVGQFLSIYPAPIKAFDGVQEIIYSINKVSPGEYWGKFSIQKETGVINIDKELDREKASLINMTIMASLKNDSMKTADTMVVVSVADVNEPPVIDAVAYSRVISNEMPPGYPVVKVEATDPDVGETLRYSLVEPRSMFAVEPSSGQVYVVSVAGQSGIVSLQVKVEDQHGLYDTTRVEVTIEDVSNSVTISLNQPHDVVMDKVMEMKEALQKALGLDVEIISVTEGSDGETLVVLIAKETSGNILPAEDLKNAFINEKEKVQTELAVVFGPDVDFEIFEKDSDTTMTIILATVIPVIGIATIVAAVLTIRRQRGRKAERRNSENSLDIRGNF